MDDFNDNDLSEQERKKPLAEVIVDFFDTIYSIYRFILRFFKQLLTSSFEWKEIIKQSFRIGYNSLAIITLTAFITGIVFTKQSRPSLADFGATSWLPSLIGIAIIRALAPLTTALIAAGKIGSNISAELGSMNVSEQIDAMEVSGTNPFGFLVVTRVLATTCMLPVLTCYSGFVGLMGAFLNIHQNESTSFTAFIHDTFVKISLLDLFASLFKSIIYGFTIGITGCFLGYTAREGTVGVGKAANTAVVASMFLIFIEEIAIVQVVNALR